MRPRPPFLAAAVQFAPTLADKARNTDRLVELTQQAFRQGARLVVHPEMSTTGYVWQDRAEVAPYAEPIPGPTVEKFADLARQHDGWIVAALPELEPATGGLYNSAALIGPQGLAGGYRKAHSYIAEVRWARDGDLGLPVFDTPLGRLGVLICMDAEYPEAARVLALAGCDVVCFPTNWLSEKTPSAYWMQRAWENGQYWICANRLGTERQVQFSGGSAILGPEGEVQATIDDVEGIVLADVDPGRSARARSRRLSGRRPELYQALAINSYLWPSTRGEDPVDPDGLDGLAPMPGPAAVRMAVRHSRGYASRILDELDDQLTQEPADILAVPPLRMDSSWPQGSQGDDASVASQFASLVRSLPDLAKVHECVIGAGGPLAEGTDLFDCAVLALLDGTLFIHRNTHPGPDRAWAAPGDQEPPVLSTPFGLVGLLTGDELVIPELARTLAGRGAEFIVAIAALDEPRPRGLPATKVPLTSGITDEDPLHWFLPRVRAAENNAWLAFANAGELPSGIFGPSYYRAPRHESVSPDGAARLTLAARPDDRDRRLAIEKPYLKMRVTRLYSSLTTSGRGHDYQ
jgi:predicted amidohydrolase